MSTREGLSCTGGAINALATGGTLLVLAREHTPPEGQELIDALREDIKAMIGDVEALQDVIRGR